VIGRALYRTVRRSWNTEYEGAVLGLAAMVLAWAISGLFADLFIDTLVFFYLGFLFSIDRRLQHRSLLTSVGFKPKEREGLFEKKDSLNPILF